MIPAGYLLSIHTGATALREAHRVSDRKRHSVNHNLTRDVFTFKHHCKIIVFICVISPLGARYMATVINEGFITVESLT